MFLLDGGVEQNKLDKIKQFAEGEPRANQKTAPLAAPAPAASVAKKTVKKESSIAISEDTNRTVKRTECFKSSVASTSRKKKGNEDEGLGLKSLHLQLSRLWLLQQVKIRL